MTPLVNSDIKGANPADSLLAWVKVATHSKVIPGNDLYLKSKFIIEPQVINSNKFDKKLNAKKFKIAPKSIKMSQILNHQECAKSFCNFAPK